MSINLCIGMYHLLIFCVSTSYGFLVLFSILSDLFSYLFFTFLLTLFTLHMLHQCFTWGKLFVYHMLIPSLTSLWLSYPDLVLVSLFTEFGLLLWSCLLLYCKWWCSLVCHNMHVPTSSFLALPDGSHIVTFFPPSLIDVLLYTISAFESAVNNLNILSCSAGIACIKMSSNPPLSYFTVSSDTVL